MKFGVSKRFVEKTWKIINKNQAVPKSSNVELKATDLIIDNSQHFIWGIILQVTNYSLISARNFSVNRHPCY